MNKFVDIFLELIFFAISIMLWIYEILISSDIPINISKNEFMVLAISFILFGVFYSFYMKKSKRKEGVILLLIPLLFWLFNMIEAIRYNYETYCTILSILGFATTGYCIGLSIYKLVINKNKVKWTG